MLEVMIKRDKEIMECKVVIVMEEQPEFFMLYF